MHVRLDVALHVERPVSIGKRNKLGNFTIFILTACRWIVTWHYLSGLVHISSVMMHFLSTPIPQKIF
ncbi:hypothetical protein OUZ56_000572 [Daphnia magna]|uniref:Uncharacterized protein n=1 Tax=Daphnia magna TaxID=35525 RepID=A0ABR0A0A4_9CRUS|nr:hypothetical protein OUZ56_000572 [Daphnia magna]